MKKIFNFSLIALGVFALFFSFSSFSNAQTTTGPCKIKDAYFQPGGQQSITWFNDKDSDKPTVKMVIESENCGNKKLKLSITEQDGGGPDDDIKGFDSTLFYMTASNILEITLKPGEDECEPSVNPSNTNLSYDCEWYIRVHQTSDGASEAFSNKNSPSKRLYFECDGWCDEEAVYISSSFGQYVTTWYFLGSSITDTKGPYPSITECTQKWVDYKTDTGNDPAGKCYFKINASATPSPNTITPTSTTYDGTYNLLAPIPGLVPGDSVGPDFSLGNFINNLIKVVIGIAAVLAVIMIVFGGIQWMMSDSFLGKGAGRERIKDAVLGLGLALGAYLLLVTINPDLVDINFGLDKQTTEFAKDEAAYEPYDAGDPSSTSVTSSGYKILGASFLSPSPSPGVVSFASNLKTGYTIDKIKVDTSSKNATFIAKKSGSPDIQVVTQIEIGLNGVSQPGKGAGGDKKTPIGTWKIGSDRRFSSTTSKAVFTKDGKTNLGSMFITIVEGRGIGFHGQKENLLRKTNGCVRMYNDDLILLAPHMKTGVTVEIL